MPTSTSEFGEIVVAAILARVLRTNYGDIIAELTKLRCEGVNVQF